MNKHVKCGLKLLGAPLLLAYGVLAVAGMFPAFIVSILGLASGCDKSEWPEDGWMDIYMKSAFFPFYWYREL